MPKPPSQPPATYRDVLGKFVSLQSVSDGMAVHHSTVRAWERRDRVPVQYWRRLIALARARSIRGITVDRLFEIEEATAARE